MRGRFIEGAGAAHVAARATLLGLNRAPIEPLETNLPSDTRVLEELGSAIQQRLAGGGYAFGHLPFSPDSETLIAITTNLGMPIPQSGDGPSEFVDNDSVLNIVNNYGEQDGLELRPFSDAMLPIHSESSRRKWVDQPRYVVLQCACYEMTAGQGQTILVAMRDVARQMDNRSLSILSRLFYDGVDGAAPIAWRSALGWSFSFRDFLDDGFCWRYLGHETADPLLIEEAIHSLERAIYDAAIARAIPWRPDSLLVFDNTQFFHARTAGAGAARGTRHLKRILIR